jgi:hypothetical protein
MARPYLYLGIVFGVVGISLTIGAYLTLNSIPLAATGISIIILGVTNGGLAFSKQDYNHRSNSNPLSSRFVLLVVLVLAFGAIVGLLSLFKQHDLAIYFLIEALVYFIAIWLYVALNPMSKKSMTTVSTLIFIGCLVVMTLKISINILK